MKTANILIIIGFIICSGHPNDHLSPMLYAICYYSNPIVPLLCSHYNYVETFKNVTTQMYTKYSFSQVIPNFSTLLTYYKLLLALSKCQWTFLNECTMNNMMESYQSTSISL